MYFLKYLFSLILVGHQCDYVNGGIIHQLKFHTYPIYLPLPTLQIHMRKSNFKSSLAYDLWSRGQPLLRFDCKPTQFINLCKLIFLKNLFYVIDRQVIWNCESNCVFLFIICTSYRYYFFSSLLLGNQVVFIHKAKF